MSDHQKTIKASGKCLCGAVHVSSESMSVNAGVCHCDMCRKWSGGPGFAVECHSDFTIDGEEHVTRYQSSEWAERGFCSTCGTQIFYYLKPKDLYIPCLGIFDNIDDKVSFHHQIFIDEKPDFYEFSNDTKKMTGAEVFANANADV